MTAQEYLDSLPMFQWLSFSQIPEELQHEVFLLAELNMNPEYRIGFNEIHANLFMKTKKSERAHVIDTLKELERNIKAVEWLYVDTGEASYVVVLHKEGIIKNMSNEIVNGIFTPETHIFTHYEWIADHAIMAKLKYKQIKHDTESEEGEDTEQVS